MDPESALLGVLGEKLRALATLIRYEQDFEKLKFYKREYDLVAAELRSAADGLSRKKNYNIIPFASKKPLRSA